MYHKISNPTLKKLYPIFTFGVIGAINTVLFFVFFTLFWKYLHINYLFSVSYTYFITAFIQFLANRKITFRGTSGNIFHQIMKYITMLGINYLATLFLMHFIVAHLDLSPYIASFMIIFFTASSSFLLFKFWIFKQ